MTNCNVKNCDSEAKAKGLCSKHYSSQYYAATKKLKIRPPGGSRRLTNHGYIEIYISGKWVNEHRVIAEKALGRPIPRGVQVHHANRIKTDNRPENLVICGSAAYHKLLHTRMDAMDNSGDPNFRKCVFCKQWDDPKNLVFPTYTASIWHRACCNKHYLERYRNGK